MRSIAQIAYSNFSETKYSLKFVTLILSVFFFRADCISEEVKTLCENTSEMEFLPRKD